MHSSCYGLPARALAMGLGLALALSIGVAAAPADRAPGHSTPTASAAAPASGGQAAGYVGDDTCLTCHEGQKAIEKTLHGKAQNPRTPAGSHNTCETCHGPGQKHVDSGKKADIKVFTAMSPREVSATCLTCHDRDHTQWAGSMHDQRNVTCTSCHSVHSPKSEKNQLKAASVVATCATCHKTEVMKLQRSGHMPVREGQMDCSSCHNPHGSTNVRLLKAGNWINDSCTSCHTEKRGPFLWEHAPVRDKCTSCHDPHGSNNNSMLVAKVPMLCQRCHISSGHPPTIYDQNQVNAGSNRVVSFACLNCHRQIHGSNSPAGNAFLR